MVIRILFILLLLSGCSTKMPVLQTFSEVPAEATCRVAVLPFTDRSSYPEGAEIFYKIFSSELINSGVFSVLPEGNITDLFTQLKMYPGRLPTKEQLEMIGGRLDATIFIGGDILAMQEDSSGKFMKTKMTVVLRLYNGKNGEMFWATYHRREGREYRQLLHFGRINTITTLAREMAREIINLWQKNGMQPCQDS